MEQRKLGWPSKKLTLLQKSWKSSFAKVNWRRAQLPAALQNKSSVRGLKPYQRINARFLTVSSVIDWIEQLETERLPGW